MHNAGPYPSHPGHPMQTGGNGFYNAPQAPQQQYAGYGQVNYPNNQLGDIATMDTRKRAIEALNDFLGDIKRRAIDPGNYYDVGHRLQSNNLPLPISTGFGYSTGNNYNTNNNSSNYNANGLMESFGGNNGGIPLNGGSGGLQGPLTQSYSLPLPNARTKNDLQDIDRFLEQLQSTVYENSTSAAAAGVQQPGLHTQHAGYGNFGNHSYRSSDSPPNMNYNNSSASGGALPMSSMSGLQSLTSSAGPMDTPALTPASVTSYASSSHSPMSTHSRSSMSSVNGNNMYPSLPSVTAMSDMASGYTTSAPPSGLASGFEPFGEGRRYSGGRLQRQAPPRGQADIDSEAMDVDSDGAKTPRAHAKDDDRPGSSALDPALRGTPTQSSVQSPASGAANSDSAEDKVQEAWVENIRVIETLRKYIQERLANQQYEGDELAGLRASAEEEHGTIEKDVAEVAYPVLKVEG